MNTVLHVACTKSTLCHFGPTLQLASHMNNNEIHLTLAKRGAQLPPNYAPAMVQSGK